MTLLFKRPLLWLIIIALSAGGCTRLFETDQDWQARKALQDLMAIQEKFHQKNQRYARNLLEIETYQLKYHTGIVYLEIQKAGKNHYRAIALPAESTTARVFAYDTDQGGYYEMEDEEVAQYVLGALNYIRQQQSERATVDTFSGVMLFALLVFGLRMLKRYKEPKAGGVWGAYFLSLLPLSLAVAALNHMDKNTRLSTEWLALMGTAFAVSLLCAALAGRGLIRIPARGDHHVLKGIAACVLVISLFNGLILAKTYHTYSQPKENTLYFKEGR